MSYDEYWNGSAELVMYYRKKNKIDNKRTNQEMWLQGLYTYEAFSIVITNAFRKKGTEPIEYPEKPLLLYAEEAELEYASKERKKRQENAAQFKAWADIRNKELCQQ